MGWRSMIAVAAAAVLGPVGWHGADPFAPRDLAKRLCQDRTVAIAAGRKRDGADVLSLRSPSPDGPCALGVAPKRRACAPAKRISRGP